MCLFECGVILHEWHSKQLFSNLHTFPYVAQHLIRNINLYTLKCHKTFTTFTITKPEDDHFPKINIDILSLPFSRYFLLCDMPTCPNRLVNLPISTILFQLVYNILFLLCRWFQSVFDICPFHFQWPDHLL